MGIPIVGLKIHVDVDSHVKLLVTKDDISHLSFSL